MKYKILLLLLFPSLVFAAYKVPVADDQQSSPPVISGSVLNVIDNTVTIEREGKEIEILTNSETHVFTEFGGHAFVNQICKHQNIEVWYNSPNANIKTDFAISIRIPKKCH